MRLIDADALIQDLQTYGCVTVYGRQFINAVTHRINLHTTVDAKPVHYGRWITVNNRFDSWVECSECNTVGSPLWKRCPVCEAKMKGAGNHV